MSSKPRTVADRLSAAADVSFVGRQREIAQLREAIQAAELPFVVVFVHGPGGIGKSSLTRAALRGFGADVRTLALDCRELEPTPQGFLATLAAALGVRDLVAGAGIHFEDRGVHSLKGIPGEWRLFMAKG